MGNNKGVMGYVAIIITFTIGALLLANLFIPQTTSFDTLSTTTDTLVISAAPENKSFTLSQDEISLLTIAGLTLTSNYTIDDTEAGTVTIKDTVVNGSYIASYSYEPDGYSDDTSTRAIGGILALAGIVGLLYFVFRGFGLV